MSTKPGREKSSEPFHIRYRNLFVGIFLIIPIIAIPILLFYTMSKLSFMEKWTELHVKYASTTGLNTSNDITINGIKVGHVKTMTLDDSGYV
ncbi:MAG: hypothetical protein GF401_15925, partial [Chitinivibrionales bacterium]|nr:hypothetical protein [Chitinivibrionales bacterium]